MTASGSILRTGVGIGAYFVSMGLLLFLVRRRAAFLRGLDWFLRAAVVINFALFLLMLMPESSLMGQLPERLWGTYRLDGWSADVVWVCASTAFIVIASIPFIVLGGVTEVKDRRFHRTAVFCLVWLACLPFYLGYVLLHIF